MQEPNKKTAEFKSQMFLLVLIIILVCNFIVALTLMQTTPKLRVLAQIVTPELSRTKQALQVTPMEGSPIYDTEMEELFVRSYLDWRLTYLPDLGEMRYRWGPGGPVWLLSSPMVYERFYKGKKWLEEYVKSHAGTHSIDIKNIYHLDNVWTAEVDIYSFVDDNVTVKTFIVNLKVGDKGRVIRTKYLINPRGFIVQEYSANAKRG